MDRFLIISPKSQQFKKIRGYLRLKSISCDPGSRHQENGAHPRTLEARMPRDENPLILVKCHNISVHGYYYAISQEKKQEWYYTAVVRRDPQSDA